MSRLPAAQPVEEAKADEARSALVSDIQEIRKVGGELVAKVESKVPWVLGAAAGLALLGVVVAVVKSRHRSAREPGTRGWLAKALRAAAVSAGSVAARRIVQRALDRPAPKAALAEQSASTIS